MATGLTSTGITFPDSTTQTTAAAGSTSASDLTSGTLPMARLSGTLPALNGSALTNLPSGAAALPASLEQSWDGDEPHVALIINFDEQTFNPRQYYIDTGKNFSGKYGWTGQNVTTHNGGGAWSFNSGPAGTFNSSGRKGGFMMTNNQYSGSDVYSGDGRVEVDIAIDYIGSAGNLVFQHQLIGDNQLAVAWTNTGIITSSAASTSTSTGTFTSTRAGFQNTLGMNSYAGDRNNSTLQFMMGHWDYGSHTNYLDCRYRIVQMRIYFGSGTTHTFAEPTRTFHQNPSNSDIKKSKYLGYGSGSAASGYRWVEM